MNRLLVTQLGPHLECQDCGANLQASGPYVGAVVRLRQGVFAFLCQPCNRINFSEYRLEQMTS